LTDVKPENISIELGVGMKGKEIRPKEFLNGNIASDTQHHINGGR
jgi:hypothetical protein